MVCEAFFPTGTQDHVLEPAQSRDEQPILEIINRHKASSGTPPGPLNQWWTRAPETFVVARDPKGSVVGFYCAFNPSLLPAKFLREDRVTRVWMEHLDREPIPRQQHALFLGWLTAETGEAPSAVQAACWVDLKRQYLELRPHLRRVYLSVHDVTPYAAVAATLGFKLLRDSHARSPSHSSTLMLDFGPSSVDGWLARLVAAELGFDDNGLLDCAARELVLEGRRVSLSKLEFGVMDYLQRHVGEAVPRTALLENVWEQSYDGGSNVADVVIRALRKKLANSASAIETVQGVGYRLCREQVFRSR